MKWFDIPDELLPPVYRAIKDMYAYARSLDTELREFRVYMQHILRNFFVQTCDLQTIEYWENLLGIVLFGDETIEERRQNILLYLNNASPTTEAYVRSVLAKTFGEDNYDLWFDVANDNPYDLHIDIFDADYDSIRRFMYWLLRMCPSHLNLFTGFINNSDSDVYVYGHAESDVGSVATMSINSGTAVLYYGPTSVTVDTLEL
jgi:hypothetical protein